MNIENQFVDCEYQYTHFSQKWADIITHQEQKEYVKTACVMKLILDEEHFIIRCNKFTKEREELFELISSKVKYFTHLQVKQKLFWILNCEELDILNSLGRFLQISYLIDIFKYIYTIIAIIITY